MKIIVTGSAGFIGYNLCKKLLENGNTVIGIDNFNDFYDKRRKMNNYIELANKYQYTFDTFNSNVVDSNCFEQDDIDLIYHLASRSNVRNSLEDPIPYIDDNIKTMVYILNCLKKKVENNKPIPFLIYASSSSVYGSNPYVPFNEDQDLDNIESPYALSKKVCDEFADLYQKLYGINSAGMRFFTVYGPHGRPDMAPEKFLTNIYLGKEIQKYGDGSSRRDYTYIDDVIQGLIKVTTKQIGFKVYNIGNSETTSLNEFINLCSKIVGKEAIVVQLENQKGDVPITYADINRAKESFGYEPTTKLEDGLVKTFKWLKVELDKKNNM
jgi:UDP-glucuronate 4-epimerase